MTDCKYFEYWSGRELAKVLQYSRWGNFVNLVEKSKNDCKNSGVDVLDHIAEVSNMIEIGKTGKREVNDFNLSRYDCYLIVQNGDPRKEVIALGQTYFVIQTRKQEMQEECLKQIEKEESKKVVKNIEN